MPTHVPFGRLSGAGTVSIVAPDAEARLAALHLRRPQALARAIEEDIVQRGDVPGTRLGTRAELRGRWGIRPPRRLAGSRPPSLRGPAALTSAPTRP